MNNASGGGGGGSAAIDTSAIAEAAIKADMEHRGFHQSGDDFTMNLGTMSYDQRVLVVGDGKAYILGHEDDALPEGASSLQADVFDYWPAEISRTFRDWQFLPTEGDFSGDASSVAAASQEIQLDDRVAKAAGKWLPGNARLGQDLEGLYQDVYQLNGEYAEAFWRAHVSTMPKIIDRFHALVLVLAWAVQGEAETWKQVSLSLEQLESDALAAMKSSGAPSGSDVSLEATLTVLGALATAVSIVNPGVRAVKIAGKISGASGAIKGLLGLGKKGDEGDAPKPKLGANHPDTVLTNIKNVLEQLNDDIRSEEHKIDRMLVAAHDATTDPESDGNFDLDMQGQQAPAGWLDANQDTTKVDATSIARICELYLPTVAGDLRQTRRALVVDGGGWYRPADIGIDNQGPWNSYSALQERVQHLLGDFGRELLDAADNLRQAASGLGLTDDSVNTRFDKQADRINRKDIDELQS